jgi:hypothetical protein
MLSFKAERDCFHCFRVCLKFLNLAVIFLTASDRERTNPAALVG